MASTPTPRKPTGVSGPRPSGILKPTKSGISSRGATSRGAISRRVTFRESPTEYVKGEGDDNFKPEQANDGLNDAINGDGCFKPDQTVPKTDKKTKGDGGTGGARKADIKSGKKKGAKGKQAELENLMSMILVELKAQNEKLEAFGDAFLESLKKPKKKCK